MSDKALRRQQRAAARRLAELAAAGDPARGRSRVEAQKLRDERIKALQAAKAEAEAARAELAKRETERQTFFGRMWATEKARKRRQENTPTEAEAERVAFHAMLAEERAKQNAAELERKRAAGLLYEPVGQGGGDAVAALFSCSTLWDYNEQRLNDDGTGAFVNSQLLTGRQVLHLWWAANLIAEAGGEQASYAQGTAPHWPSPDGDITYRETDMARLVECEFLEWEHGIGGGSHHPALRRAHEGDRGGLPREPGARDQAVSRTRTTPACRSGQLPRRSEQRTALAVAAVDSSVTSS